jgi:predicted TIM-barrel fold metal-dependent hydrolase
VEKNPLPNSIDKFRAIDAHHHIWRLADLAWLNGPTQPRIFGDYEAIKQDYAAEDFIADVTPEGVVGSVYIQVNWPAGQEIAEARWVQETAQATGWPHAIIGYVDFSSDACAATLKELGQFSLMRGIRQQLHWHENPLYKFAPTPDVMNDSKWRQNFALLQDYDWSFELQVFASQMPDAAQLARDFPGTPMVLQHCGMPEDTSSEGMRLWLEGMKRLAAEPNIHCKFSGLGTFIHENSVSFIGDITGQCLELFGHERCIYGSNFPIEKIWTTYTDIIQGFKENLAALPQEVQESIFYNNAKKLYKLSL